MVTGDPREAAALGPQTLDWAGTLHSCRVLDDLHELLRLVELHACLTEVADLRDRIRTSVAA